MKASIQTAWIWDSQNDCFNPYGFLIVVTGDVNIEYTAHFTDLEMAQEFYNQAASLTQTSVNEIRAIEREIKHNAST